MTKREKAAAKAKKRREQNKVAAKERRKAQQKAKKEFDLVQPEALGEQRRYIAQIRAETESYLKIVREDVVPKIPMFDELEPDQMENEVEKSLEQARIKWENVAALTLIIASAGARITASTGRKFNAQVTKATGQRMVPQPTNTRSQLAAWTTRNLRLFQNAIRDHGNRLSQTIAGGIAGSRPVSTIARGVVNAGGILRRRNTNISRDQSEKLESQLNTARLQTIGVKTFTWKTVGDDLVRKAHEDLEGKTFPVGKGAPGEGMPGDPINCFPGSTKINGFPTLQKLYRRRHTGELHTLVLDNGVVLAATSNHPILTPEGPFPAKSLALGDDVVCKMHEGFNLVEGHGEGSDITIEKIFDSFDLLGIRGSVPASVGSDFHGDATDHEVDIVTLDGSLVLEWDSSAVEKCTELGLTKSDVMIVRRFMSRTCPLGELFRGPLSSCGGGVGRLHLILPLLVGHLTPLQCLGLSLRPDVDSGLFEMTPDDCSGNSEILGNRVLAFSRFIHGDDFFFREVNSVVRSRSNDPSLSEPPSKDAFSNADVVSDGPDGFASRESLGRIIDRGITEFDGHVYNLQTVSGLYVAERVSVGNCRCSAAVNLPKR